MTSDSPTDRSWFARFKGWWLAHHHRLMSIEDTAHAIALGAAIGIFFGFTPLWSVKTLLSIFVAWLFNSSKIAAAITVTLHDVTIPIWPALYWWEYKLGYLLLNGALPARIRASHIAMYEYFHWKAFVRVIWPTLLGSIFFGIPSAILAYFIIRPLVLRTRELGKSPRS